MMLDSLIIYNLSATYYTLFTSHMNSHALVLFAKANVTIAVVEESCAVLFIFRFKIFHIYDLCVSDNKTLNNNYQATIQEQTRT